MGRLEPSSRLWIEPEAVREMDAMVVAVLPELHHAKIKDQLGRQYSITDKTDGVAAQDLRKGQKLHCVVTKEYPRVIRASVIG